MLSKIKRTAGHCEPDSATVKATRDSFRELCMSDDLGAPGAVEDSASAWPDGSHAGGRTQALAG